MAEFRFHLFGNCVINSLKWVLEQHVGNDTFVCISTLESWKASKQDVLRQLSLVNRGDIFIMQPHSDRLSDAHAFNFIKNSIPFAKVISIPSLYLPIYNPFEFNSKIAMSLVNTSDHLVYTDALKVLYHSVRNKCCETVAAESYSDFLKSLPPETWEDARNRADRSLNALKRQELERECNIHLFSFIEQHYRTKVLMNTLNHPTGLIMLTHYREICGYLGLDESLPTNYTPQFFDHYKSTMYPQFISYGAYSIPSDDENTINDSFDTFSSELDSKAADVIRSLRLEVRRFLDVERIRVECFDAL